MAQVHSHPPHSHVTPAYKHGDGSLIDFSRVLRGLRERWFGTLVCTVLVCGGVGYLLLQRPAVYAATSTLLVERSTDRVLDIKQVVDTSVDSSLTDAQLLTHIQQIRGDTFLSRVASSFTPEEQERIRAPYLVKPKFAFFDQSEVSDRIEDIIKDNLRVERTGRTLLIGITIRHRDPEVAQVIANRIADQYIAHLLHRSTTSNESALSFLTGQAEDLRKKLEAADKKAQLYREEHNLVTLDQNQNLDSERLRTLSTAITRARVTRLGLEARLSQIEAILNGKGDMRQLAGTAEFAGFADVQKQIDQLQAKRTALSERYGRMHPLMLENASSLQTLEKLRQQQIAAAMSDLRNQRDKAAVEEKQLTTELAAGEKESLQREQLANTYSALRREVESTRETYSQILSRLNETTISSRLQNTNIKVVGRAGLPVRPVEPNRTKVLAILGMLGAFVIVAYPWAAQARDKRIRGVADVEGFLGATLIGEIPDASSIPREDRGMIVARAIDQNMVEAFRGLYSQFRLASKAESPKIALVTSTIPGEGKSFVACNLGAAFAAHGRRTLLIDADLRRPTLHTAFKLNNQNGILTWMRAKQTTSDPMILNAALGIRQVASRLFVLRAGGVSDRFTEFLQAGPLGELIAGFKKDFDLVLIDTSPAGVFPDAEAFSSVAEELVYVCRYKGANREHARQTLTRLSKTNMALRGVAINGIPGGRSSVYYMSSYAVGAGRYRRGYAHSN
jgi:polysaccharide biosynthesis transport protein